MYYVETKRHAIPTVAREDLIYKCYQAAKNRGFHGLLRLQNGGWCASSSTADYGRPFVSKLWHDIPAVLSHVYLQPFLLHDIRAFFCHVYLRSFLLCGVFIPKYMTIFLQTRIYMRTKKPIYMRYKQACGIWGYRKSSYKRHRIIPSAKNPFMYDGAEK